VTLRGGRPRPPELRVADGITEQELELKTNTQLTREIPVLTAELHKRYIEKPARQQS